MSTLNELELLKIKVHNLELALKRKNEMVTKLKDAHLTEVKQIKKEYT